MPYILRSTESSGIGPRRATAQDGFIFSIVPSFSSLDSWTPPQDVNGCDARVAYGGGGGSGLTRSVESGVIMGRGAVCLSGGCGRRVGCAGAAAAAAFVTLNTSRFWPTATQGKGEGERGRMELPGHGMTTATPPPSAAARPTHCFFAVSPCVRACVVHSLEPWPPPSSLLAPSRNTCACSPSLPPRPGRSLLPLPPPLLSFSSCSRHHHHRRRTHLELFFFFVRVPPSLPPSAVPPAAAAAQATFYGQGNHDFS